MSEPVTCRGYARCTPTTAVTLSGAAVQAAYEALRSGVRRGEVLAGLMTDRGEPESPVYEPGTANVPDAAQRERLRQRVAASPAAQGLRPYITDAAVFDKIADLLMVTLGRADRHQKPHPRPLSAAGPHREHGAEKMFDPSAWRRESRRRRHSQREDRAASVPVSTGMLARGWARVRYGWPAWLAARIVVAGAVISVAELAAPGDPAVPALTVGAVTCLVLQGRMDMLPVTRARRKQGFR
jgi:hypothetical protein